MTVARPVRVGVLGLGKVTQLHHLPNLLSLPDFEVAGLCDLSGDLARHLARRHGLPEDHTYTEVEDLLAVGLDALVVANRHHGPVVRTALEAGLPVFVEKPVCWGLDEAADLVRLQERTGTPVVVGYMKRYDPAVERLAADGLGDVLHGRVHNFAGGRHRHERLHPVLKPGPDGAAHPLADEDARIDALIGARFDGDSRRVQALRTLAELGIHDLNLLHGLVGDLEVVSASATRTPAGICYLATLGHGALSCTVEILADFGSARDWDEQATFYTAEGVVELAFASPFLRNAPTVLRRRGARGLDVYEEDLIVSRRSPYLCELQHFHDVVTGVAASRTPLAAAVRDLRLVYALVAALGAEAL